MKRRRIVVRYPLWISLLLPLIAACSVRELAGGSGSTTTNGMVVGKVVTTTEAGASRTQVGLFRCDYDPVKDAVNIPTDTTDSLGRFSFSEVPQGDYVVLAVHLDNGTRALIGGIHAAGDTFTAPTATLRAPGSIKIALAADMKGATGYVFVPGTTYSIFLNYSTAFVVLDSVPAGIVPAVSYASTNSAGSAVIRYNVPVSPGATTVVWNPLWKYARTFVLNTSAGGANVTTGVENFPVLIRLNSGNFDFSQAQATGADILFAKSDNTFLPYEIERWDAGNKVAEIWVKVDTVHGGDSAQPLMMYWGNGNAAAQSNPEAVFDTAAGFAGVWHLGEAGNAIAKDATGNHFDGAPSDTAPAGAEGTIGPCRSFNGVSNYIRMNGTAASKLNFQENGTYTLSAWAYADTLDNGFHLVAGKNNEQYFLKFKQSIPTSPMVWEFVEYHDKAGWYITNTLPILPSAKAWTYIVGVRKGTAQYFYLNGEPVDSTISVSPSNAPRHTGDDVTIGRFLSIPADTMEGKCPFLGMIDEVRISDVACRSEWIKLCYMNQKEPDALVQW
jgi:hypothetical protein